MIVYSAERWKQIEGWPYRISDHGRVFSDRARRMLKPHVDTVGYPRVDMRLDNSQNRQTVHRLVASNFIENPLNKPCVNHIDGDKTNNHYANLEWCTVKENYDHAVDTGLFKMATGEAHHMSVLDSDKVVQIRAMLRENIPQRAIAKEFGVSQYCIACIYQGKTWTHVKEGED